MKKSKVEDMSRKSKKEKKVGARRPQHELCNWVYLDM